MLLFSTILDMKETMTKEIFIQLVIEWNQESPHESNIISGIKWNGERNIRYGNENLWMDIEEYRNQNIVAVRYEKKAHDGVIWGTDYIMNFNTMKMAIRLDRSFLEEALVVDSRFSTPHFITMLIERGYVKDDNELPVTTKPIYIDDTNLEVIINIINGEAKYRLPVIYISKTYHDENPVHVINLAYRLKGAAHVLVQQSNCSNMRIKEACNEKNEYYGAIGIYYPKNFGHKKYLYRTSVGMDNILFVKVIRAVIQYSNSQMVDSLYTWQGVNNALLTDKLVSQKMERANAEMERKRVLYELLELQANLNQKQESMRQQALEEAKIEADKLLESFDEEFGKQLEQISNLSKKVEKLEYENQGLRAKLDSNDAIPLLVMGMEDDFYQGEIKDLVLYTLKKGLETMEGKTRRHDVVSDIISANDYKGISEQKAEKLKRALKNYDGMTSKLKRELEELGFQLESDKSHYKGRYYGDGRYTVVYGKTPSDGRAGKNNADITIKKVF